jgi:YVTN family beta-propeller protein
MSPDGRTVYVASEGAGTVTPIDVASNRAGRPIFVGWSPTSMVIKA